MRRWVAAASIATLLAGMAIPALAQDSPEETPEIVPGVVVEETAPDEEAPDWTYRYLVPTSLALALVFCVVTVVLYFTKVVRSRYKSVG